VPKTGDFECMAVLLSEAVGFRFNHVKLAKTRLMQFKTVAKVMFGKGRIELLRGKWGCHLIQCFLGLQKSPPQTGRRSVQPFLYSPSA